MGTVYRVGEVATLTGVSVRTLHHYDRIGLLRPASYSEGRHRLYTGRDLLRLQQVLTLRYLGFPLKQIKVLLDRPDFDLLPSLRVQRRALQGRIGELERIEAALGEMIERRMATGTWSWDLVAQASAAVQHGLNQKETEVSNVRDELIMEATLPNRWHRGKVRDTYDLGDRLLIVATDRISAFDVVLPDGIPSKGAVLTQLSGFWFDKINAVVPTHFLRVADGSAADDLPFALPPELIGRSTIAQKAERVDVECVVRGYITGSGWSDYQQTGAVCGIRLPEGLVESQQLPQPIFTPTTKAETGHDEPMTYEQLVELVGAEAANVLKLRSLAVYQYAWQYAAERGIIIADTKFEFGYVGGELILIDEVLTPDSSRFWPLDQFAPGHGQPSFDKQPVRDYLSATGWNKQPPAPSLPAAVITDTSERYREAYRLLTGRTLAPAGATA